MTRVSLFYLVGLFDLWSGIRTLFISSAGAYLIASYVDDPFMPWIGFVFLMGHMSLNHIHRQSANVTGKVDITGAFARKTPRLEDLLTTEPGAQMVLVMKVSPRVPYAMPTVQNPYDG